MSNLTMIPDWQYNTLPGNANQGALLMTRNDITYPPFTQDDFIFIAMEDVIGTANVKLEYDEKHNIYRIYKATGHRNNNGDWSYTWTEFGSWERITEEVAQALRDLVYVSYRYDTSVANTLTVYGVKKDMTEDLMVSISFVSKQEFDEGIETLTTNLNAEIQRATNRENEINTRITNEITRATNKENEIATNLANEVTRATNREDELEDLIEHNQAISGNATTVTQSSSGRIVDVNVDDDSIKITSNQLKADVFDDTQVRNDKGWSSAKISQEMTSAMHYKGQVPTYADLPTSGQQIGDCWNVETTGDNYAWNGSGWDKLSGEYIAGEGISINGKVISSTGISFSVGDGLDTSGAGSTQTLFTKNGLGLEYDANRANKVKAGTGITVNASGVNINTGNTTQTVSNKIEVKPYQGVQNTANGLSAKVTNGCMLNANGIGINANWTVKSTPLNTQPSKLALYSDGKIGVDFEESPVVLTAQVLNKVSFASGRNYAENITINDYNAYDMFAFQMFTETSAGISGGSLNFFIKKASGVENISFSHTTNNAMSGSTPTGVAIYQTLMDNFNFTNGNIGNISRWSLNNAITGNWYATSSSIGITNGIFIYGIKAR